LDAVERCDAQGFEIGAVAGEDVAGNLRCIGIDGGGYRGEIGGEPEPDGANVVEECRDPRVRHRVIGRHRHPPGLPCPAHRDSHH
jgi:hypothetical protein